MDLWIRNQKNDRLVKCENIDILDRNQIEYVKDILGNVNITIEEPIKLEVMIIGNNSVNLGTYKTKERAIEVLDEIQDKIKMLLYLKPKSHLQLKEIEAGKRYFEKMNGIDFITCDNNFEIEPITTNVIIYEMPQE